MIVTVQLFARTKELAGTGSVRLDLPESATVEMAKATLIQSYPPLESMASLLIVAVNGHYAQGETRLVAGDELACFPPVSGG